MEITYGEGTYIDETKNIKGNIILSEHKLFLKGPSGDLTQTYIPLEKIERVQRLRGAATFQIRPTISFRYVATIKGEREGIAKLVAEIVQRRGLRKKFLKSEWVETPS